jgi:hypothetical protein
MKTIYTTLLLLFISINTFSQIRIYPLDGNANEILSGLNGTMGTGIHLPTTTTDRFNNLNGALFFDGNDYIQIPTTGILNDSFAVTAWVTVSSFPGFSIDQDLFSVGDHSSIGEDQALGIGDNIYGHGLFFAGYTSGNEYRLFQQGPFPAPDFWHHIAGVYSQSMIKFYVDGVLYDSVATNNSVPHYTPLPTAFIGTRDVSLFPWYGKIDDLRIYSKGLSGSDVISIALGIDNVSQQNNFMVFPNPAHENISIGSTPLNGTVTIYNSIGEKLKELKIENEEEINLSIIDFAAGIYFINYLGNKTSYIGKFVKE